MPYVIPTALSSAVHTVEADGGGPAFTTSTDSTVIAIDTATPTVSVDAPDFKDYRPVQITVHFAESFPIAMAPQMTVHLDIDLNHNGRFNDAGEADGPSAIPTCP